MDRGTYEIEHEWKHLRYRSNARFAETYGFSGSQGDVNLEGILLKPVGKASSTLLLFMHPASTLQLLPLPRQLVSHGCHVLCAGSRYQRNDAALIMENVVLDMGAYIRTAKEDWGYDKVVICGWSGGGSLSTLYQSQAEVPSITETPAGDPVNIVGAGLIPADGLINMAAHYSRARLLAEWLDPSVMNESEPDKRDPELDLYRAGYDDEIVRYEAEFLTRYRAAQLSRMRRITTWVQETLADLRSRQTAEVERGFVTHRTMADPRFIDVTIDPNGRKPLWTFMGHPETVNSGPVGLARFSTLRSWLSQWSIDHSRADSIVAGKHVSVPFLAVECGADDAAPQPHTRKIFESVGSKDKSMKVIQGANHYFVGQPEHLIEGGQLIMQWLMERRLLND